MRPADSRVLPCAGDCDPHVVVAKVICPLKHRESTLHVLHPQRQFQPLADITSLLGEPHPATSTQAKQLVGVMDKMPAEVRANAERDKTLAWGDDSNFLVVKVNDEGVAWVTAWRSR